MHSSEQHTHNTAKQKSGNTKELTGYCDIGSVCDEARQQLSQGDAVDGGDVEDVSY